MLELKPIIFGTHSSEPLRKPFSGQYVVYVDDGIFSFDPADAYHLPLLAGHNSQIQALPISFLGCIVPDIDDCTLID